MYANKYAKEMYFKKIYILDLAKPQILLESKSMFIKCKSKY